MLKKALSYKQKYQVTLQRARKLIFCAAQGQAD